LDWTWVWVSRSGLVFDGWFCGSGAFRIWHFVFMPAKLLFAFAMLRLAWFSWIQWMQLQQLQLHLQLPLLAAYAGFDAPIGYTFTPFEPSPY